MGAGSGAWHGHMAGTRLDEGSGSYINNTDKVLLKKSENFLKITYLFRLSMRSIEERIIQTSNTKLPIGFIEQLIEYGLKQLQYSAKNI